jgi:5'-nucleotidase
LIGASPLLSGLLKDAPTLAALSQMGLAASAVGNHEFDQGAAELLRKQKSVPFHYLAANVVRADGTTLLPSTDIRTFGGVKVAFIGVVLKGAAEIVAAPGVAGLSFRDEAESVNALIPGLRARGIEAIVVLIHQGADNKAGRNDCDVSGPILDIVKRLDKAVDVVVSGHTHQAYNCVIDGRLLTSAHRYGTMVTEIDLTLDRKSHDVIAAHADNLLVRPDLPADPAVARIVARAEKKAAPLAHRIVGNLTAPPSITPGSNGESAMGDLVADGMLAAVPGGEIAFTNSGGIRTQLSAGPVSYGDLFAVLPFGNRLMAMDLTGAQIKALLEQQWSGSIPRVLQVSHGFSYRWDASHAAGERVLAGSLTLNGEPLAPERVYRVVTSDFLAGGGDGLTLLRQGANQKVGGDQMEAVAGYLSAHGPYTPSSPDRIGRVN